MSQEDKEAFISSQDNQHSSTSSSPSSLLDEFYKEVKETVEINDFKITLTQQFIDTVFSMLDNLDITNDALTNEERDEALKTIYKFIFKKFKVSKTNEKHKMVCQYVYQSLLVRYLFFKTPNNNQDIQDATKDTI